MVRILAAISDAERLDWLVTHVVGHASHYDLRQVLVPEVTAIYGWLAQVPGRAAGCRAVVGALPERIARGDGRAGPGAEGLGPRGRPGLQVRRLPGLGRLLARSGGPRGTFSASQGPAAAPPRHHRRPPVRLHARHRAQRLAANVGLHQDPGVLRAAAQAIRPRLGVAPSSWNAFHRGESPRRPGPAGRRRASSRKKRKDSTPSRHPHPRIILAGPAARPQGGRWLTIVH